MALKTLIFGLLVASVAANEKNTRSSRQLTYSDKPVYQPTVQYYFIDKVQNGPALGSADSQPRLYNPYSQYANSFRQPTAESEPGEYNYERTDFTDGEEVSYRQLGILNGFLNNRFTNGNANLNTFRPFSSIVPPYIPNPDNTARFGSCEAGNGERGICVLAPSCALYGGRASGSCRGVGYTCCVNTVNRCGGIVTLNNTHWQSPANQLTSPTSCTLTVKLDQRSLKEQTLPICQVRLDFSSFSIAQPAGTTVCGTDTFQVGGALNTVPTICGDNDNQHMYLHVPPSDVTPTDLRLTFNFGPATFTRSWNIRIAMLPCASSSLAPPDCLQYFSSASGTVQSFNWKDIAVANADARELANQNYKVCFRTENVNSRRANTICFSQCTVTNGGDAFRISGVADGPSRAGTDANAAGSNYCPSDFIVIAAATGVNNDRYCGNMLHTTNGAAIATLQPTPVCSTARSFELYYVTDETDAINVNQGNVGFCLQFNQQVA